MFWFKQHESVTMSYDGLQCTHPPTPAGLSLEYGALSRSIAATSFFFESLYNRPEMAETRELFTFHVILTALTKKRITPIYLE